MRLKRFKIENYKIIDNTDWVEVDRSVTALVGKNESGKTGVLRALWKSRNESSAEFDKLNDYPRDRYSKDRKGAQYVVHTEYALDPAESKALAALISVDTEHTGEVQQSVWYSGEDKIERRFCVPAYEPLRTKAGRIHDLVENVVAAALEGHKECGEAISKAAGACKDAVKKSADLWAPESVAALNAFRAALLAAAPAENVLAAKKADLDKLVDEAKKGDPLASALKWLSDNTPIYIYFDDYGQLETRISLPAYIQKVKTSPDAKTRTQRALFAHSNLDPDEILSLGRVREASETEADVERRKDKRRALLQSASFGLTGDWVNWWTEKRHKLHFDADGDDLVLQVSDENNEFPIPFEERSQGFQWFFSFFLVFLVESENEHRDAILLLDEPGLHLHPTLQQKLVGFFERVSKKNQILFSTHLPFLIDGDHLDRVRTVFRDTDTAKTVVSPDIRAGADHDTLFPIQAALGYAISQTLFIGKKIVIVEGITDYWLIKAIGDVFVARGIGTRLDADIVLVPAGGTSRLMPLASLMFGAGGMQGKNMIVLLDGDREGLNAKARLEVDLFPDDSRVVVLSNVFESAKCTIEDLVDRDTYIAAVNGAGYQVNLDASERQAICNLDAVSAAFNRLGLGEVDKVVKTKAALWLVARWGSDPLNVTPETVTKASLLFGVLCERMASTTSG